MRKISDLRPSPIAGLWYSDDPERLGKEIDGYLQAAPQNNFSGEVVAIVVPHAGHRYSGAVAGHAFRALMGQHPARVAIISPMHQPYPQPLLTTVHAAYQTPLGAIPVDRDAVFALDENLRSNLGFGISPVANDPEHSLEIELPFLQRVFTDPFTLIPVMVRDQTRATAWALGQALAKTLEEYPAILVASTDLSHFYPERIANNLDAELLRQVAAFNPDGIFEVEEKGTGFACGRGALAAVLWAAHALGADRVEVVDYSTSGRVTGDLSSVVGYGAAVVLRPL